MRVSMTWPQYRRRQCVVGGQGVRLTPRQADIVLALLLTLPGRFATADALFGVLWPNPDDEPESLAPNYISVYVRQLRKRGLSIESSRQGWRLPERELATL